MHTLRQADVIAHVIYRIDRLLANLAGNSESDLGSANPKRRSQLLHVVPSLSRTTTAEIEEANKWYIVQQNH